jgi:SAM-dependent methyltransferase
MQDRNREGWAKYLSSKIPTKTHIPHVERWLSTLSFPVRILDVGCGTGSVSRLLLKEGCSVVGIDINGAAIEELAREFSHLRHAEFYVRDVISVSGFELRDNRFNGVVCQLVASVVGDRSNRIQLLKNIHVALVLGGKVSISFSGLSDDINANYAELYKADMIQTSEYGTYFSRDDAGNILYQTHHFSVEEIKTLLQNQGFCEILIEEKIEASSRRPEERARFYYVTCERSFNDNVHAGLE